MSSSQTQMVLSPTVLCVDNTVVMRAGTECTRGSTWPPRGGVGGNDTQAGQSLPTFQCRWACPHESCRRLPRAGERAQGDHVVHRFHLQKRGCDFPQGPQLWKNYDYNPSCLGHSLHGTLSQVRLSLLFRLPGSTEHLDGY